MTVNSFTKFTKNSPSWLFPGILLLATSLYYFLFLGKGLVLGDEGYSLHIAERILNGQLPYKDFFLQYPPLFFYVLGLFFLVFTPSVLAGRILTFILCLGILLTTFFLLRILGINSKKTDLIACLCIAAFGFPHIPIPVVVWPTVLVTELLMIILVKIIKNQTVKYSLLLGILLTILFALKQNIALSEMIVINVIVVFLLRKTPRKLILPFFIINSIWVAVTILWIFLLFSQNFHAFSDFIGFNSRYFSIYPFNYPTPIMLLEPLGIIKLIPYYLPILFILLLLYCFLKDRLKSRYLVFLLPFAGFFTTIFPTTDLLHIYPYYGVVLVCFYVFMNQRFPKFSILTFFIIGISVLSGIFLSFTKGYYQPPFFKETTQLMIPRAKGITVNQEYANSLTSLYTQQTQVCNF